MDLCELSPVERATSITYRLARGEKLKPRDIAITYAVSRNTAYRTLDAIARVIPIRPADDGVWFLPDAIRK